MQLSLLVKKNSSLLIWCLSINISLFSQQNFKQQTQTDLSEILSVSIDSSVHNQGLKSTPQNGVQQLKLPYPIIFIHGLNSSSETWNTTTDWMDSQYGLSFGGRLDFCLNYDADYSVSNINFNTQNADLAMFTPTLNIGDYYYLNFDVGFDGVVQSTSGDYGFVTSNQSAITKQGIAVKWAIKKVLEITGRDKVLLMGHSMGGLAAREYLQNTSNWQSDGQHHVAKLITTATPHGGSNSTLFGFGEFAGLDEESEAVRDLRRSYYYSLDSGVYLFGGFELQDNETSMDDNLGIDFYNEDVNCNGIIGQYILGLNQKNIINTIDYSCIIGNCDGCVEEGGIGDGVVNIFSANLNNFYPELNAKTFYYNAIASTQIHTDLPKQHLQNMQGLDEPNEHNLAYTIELDSTYLGFTTIQSLQGYLYDYDNFSFSVPIPGIINVQINNILLSDLMVNIIDMNGVIVGTTNHSNGASTINFTQALNEGNYYLEIFGTPTDSSYLHPYNFKVDQIEAVSIQNLSNEQLINIFPNPTSTLLNISGLNNNAIGTFYDLSGKQVYQTVLYKNSIIDLSHLTKSIYTFVIDENKRQSYFKIIITE